MLEVAEVTEDTAIIVELDNEISFLSDFPDDPVLLEAEGFNNVIEEILMEEKIEEEVKSCMKDLIDNVEKAVQPSKKRSNFRKRPINKPTWIVNNHKKAHESGQEHLNNKGKLNPVKKIVSKKDCDIKCKFNCTQKIDRETQESIFMAFHKLDTNSKHSFIAQTRVSSSVAGMKEGRKKSSCSRFLIKGEDSFGVCKSFYLSTLAISQKMVYNFHQKKNKVIGMLKWDGRGKHDKHAKVSDEQKNGVMSHIDSFPVIKFHYCRAKTNKKYFEAGLSIQKMYDLYKEKCIRENRPWVKSTYYHYIFNTCYNIDFHIPKTDVKRRDQDAGRSRLSKVKIYQLALRKRTFTICT